jgi:hypothetical protein
MYRQVLDPVSHSLGTTSIFAILPLLVLFLLLGVFRCRGGDGPLRGAEAGFQRDLQ